MDRGDAAERGGAQMKTVTDPDDRDAAALVALLERTLADPNTVLGIDRVREFLAEPAGGRRVFSVLVAKRDDEVVGGAIFSYVPASNCGFSEYIVAAQADRGTGLGRRIFDARKAILDEQARATGQAACNGLFIEVDSPERTPPELLEAERETALDAWERLRVFAHLGFRHVDVRYVQPPLASSKHAIDYLDLLFAPWASDRTSIPSAWVIETVDPVWRAWAPETATAQLAGLRAEIGAREVGLAPLRYTRPL